MYQIFRINPICKYFHQVRLMYINVFAFKVNVIGKLFQKYHAFVMKAYVCLSYENTYN